MRKKEVISIDGKEDLKQLDPDLIQLDKKIPARLQLQSPTVSELIKKENILSLYPVEGGERAKQTLLYYHNRADYQILKEAAKERKLNQKLQRWANRLIAFQIKNEWVSFIRWIVVDFLRGKKRRMFGIYQFIALPGEGKTMSMVAHMERFRQQCEREGKPYRIACNFSYAHSDVQIKHWVDMVETAKWCYIHGYCCLIAFDEIHVTFDSTDWKDFPAEVLAMLSFNRKYGLEFCCTSQIYERIPKKIRDIANYTVICKNIWHCDRMFRCYYFSKTEYETEFAPQLKKCKFIRSFVAGDTFYALYDTLEQVDNMVKNAKQEKDSRLRAYDILFGSVEGDQAGGDPVQAKRPDAPAIATKSKKK